MWYWILAAGILFLLLSILGIGVYFALKLYRLELEYQSAKQRFVQFVTSPEEGKPSEFSQVISAMGYELGHSAAIEIKTTIMGAKSGISKAVQGELIDQAAGGQPAIGGLLSALGAKNKKSILNHPLAQMLLGNLINKGMPGNQDSQSGSNHNVPVKFKL
jgi:hypothetical protein